MSVVLLLVRLALSAWLTALAVQDIRKGEASNWLTVPPLLLVTAWRALTDGWPVGLALALVLAAAQWPRLTLPALAGMGLCLWWAVPAGLETAVGVWALCFVLWRLGVIGGADAKVVMTLAALFPDERLAWLLLLAWFALSVIHLIVRRGRNLPRSLLRAASGLLKLQVNEGAGIRCPALPAVALAGLIFLWLYL